MKTKEQNTIEKIVEGKEKVIQTKKIILNERAGLEHSKIFNV